MPSRDVFVKFWWQTHQALVQALCALAKKTGGTMIVFETVWLL
ncbi:hypothetical protein [Azospirillum endophyticum]